MDDATTLNDDEIETVWRADDARGGAPLARTDDGDDSGDDSDTSDTGDYSGDTGDTTDA